MDRSQPSGLPQLKDLHITQVEPLLPPAQLWTEVPLSPAAAQTVEQGRRVVRNILWGRDKRLLGVVGPCSIHDPDAALEYARRLKHLADEVADKIYLVMRVYFEKPRTSLGWRGLIWDPHLDGSYDIETGLRRGRQLLVDVNALGMPAATEMLDPIVPQYIADLITWSAIGARTTESQTHREMASGLSMPVGFKNGTDGSLDVAINAMAASRQARRFLGVDPQGQTAVLTTEGNPDVHMILRGGRHGPNYQASSVEAALKALKDSGHPAFLMVDCSHANSNKDFRKQPEVFRNLVTQVLWGQSSLKGFMIEGHLQEGSQPLEDPKNLKYGISITDGCLGWDDTQALIRDACRVLA